MDFRPVFFIVGLFVIFTSGLMIFPMLADLLAGHGNWRAFAAAALISGVVGTGLSVASADGKIDQLTTRQSFLMVTLIWLAIAAMCAIPFILGSRGLSVTDAFFESMSGLTTTGSTVVTGLDTSPPGFLLWRSILQWLGGAGVIIMASALLPFLAVGGMQLFRMEAYEPSEKILPGATQFASAITLLYVALTTLCFVAFWACGMTPFDAVNHAMTTIATGGFSTHDASFAYFLSDPDIRFPVDIVATVFMILGALPFTLFLLMLSGNITGLTGDQEVRLYLLVTAISTALIAMTIGQRFGLESFHAFRLAFFNVVSLMTGTGYASADYWLWGSFAAGFFFIIPFVGGCSGSTSCGLKVFRLQVAFAALALHIRRLSHPNSATVARYNGRIITDDVFLSVLSFFFIYFAVFATAAVILSNLGLDTVTALSAAATSIANVGPGLGEVVGPSGNFSSLPDAAKWVMSITMLIGRLELLTVLVLFTPGFWTR